MTPCEFDPYDSMPLFYNKTVAFAQIQVLDLLPERSQIMSCATVKCNAHWNLVHSVSSNSLPPQNNPYDQASSQSPMLRNGITVNNLVTSDNVLAFIDTGNRSNPQDVRHSCIPNHVYKRLCRRKQPCCGIGYNLGNNKSHRLPFHSCRVPWPRSLIYLKRYLHCFAETWVQ